MVWESLYRVLFFFPIKIGSRSCPHLSKMQEIDIGNCFYDQTKLNQYVRDQINFLWRLLHENTWKKFPPEPWQMNKRITFFLILKVLMFSFCGLLCSSPAFEMAQYVKVPAGAKPGTHMGEGKDRVMPYVCWYTHRHTPDSQVLRELGI